MKPFRIEFIGQPPFSNAHLLANAAQNTHRHRIERGSCAGRKLAVVGGGPLVVNDLDELRAWDGDIWAINFMAPWLTERGVRCKLFSGEPDMPHVASDGAIIGSYVKASTFDAYGDAALAVDFVETVSDGLPGGQSGATRTPAVAFSMGYMDVSFFGCEGSFDDADHVDRHENLESILIIRAGGVDYKTRPDFLLYTKELAQLITTLNGAFHNRSGGLLKAMIENMDTWEIVGVSAALKTHLEEMNGKQGIFDDIYQPLAA